MSTKKHKNHKKQPIVQLKFQNSADSISHAIRQYSKKFIAKKMICKDINQDLKLFSQDEAINAISFDFKTLIDQCQNDFQDDLQQDIQRKGFQDINRQVLTMKLVRLGLKAFDQQQLQGTLIQVSDESRQIVNKEFNQQESKDLDKGKQIQKMNENLQSDIQCIGEDGNLNSAVIYEKEQKGGRKKKDEDCDDHKVDDKDKPLQFGKLFNEMENRKDISKSLGEELYMSQLIKDQQLEYLNNEIQKESTELYNIMMKNGLSFGEIINDPDFEGLQNFNYMELLNIHSEKQKSQKTDSRKSEYATFPMNF